MLTFTMSAWPGRTETETPGAATVSVVEVAGLETGEPDVLGLASTFATQVLSTRTRGSPSGPSMGVRIMVHTSVKIPVLLKNPQGRSALLCVIE